MNSIVIIAVVIIVLYGAYTMLFKKKESKIEFSTANSETMDDELHLTDVVGFFKLQNLDKDKDTPFIATEKFMEQYAKYEKKEGYVLLFCGKTDKDANNIAPLRLFYAKAFDEKIQELIKDDFVVLQ